MEQNWYIVLNAAFVAANANYTKGNLMFAHRTTTSGVIVCAKSSMDEFPELFGINDVHLPSITIIELSPADFPAQTAF